MAEIDYNNLFINKLNKKYVSMKRLTYLLLCLFASIAFATAQTAKVTGTVISAEDDGPIIGASIVVAGTTIGTVTDHNGAFTLDVPSNAQKLIISYIGMKSVEVTVKPIIKVSMESDSQNLDEIVVVGYGTQRKKDVTSAISKVGGEDLANLAAPSFDTQLAGRAAGVQVTTPSGVLGSGPQFKVRGMSTISASSQPLFIIDGMPLAVGDNSSGSTGMGMLYAEYNAMSDINPNDIESIEILKDGAATAIYGSRAANGVILITTKKGSKGRTSVNYDGYITAASPAKLHDLLGAKDFVTIANEKYENWGMKGQAVYDPNGPDTNWNDYIFRTGFQHNHSLSASGGTDKSQYYVSLGFTEQEGIVRANDLNRLSLKADLTQQATKWFRIGLNGQMTRTIMNGVMNGENSLGGVGFAGTRMLPNVDVYNPDDPTGYNIDAENRKALGRGGNLSYIDNGVQNIVWALDNNVNRTTNTRVIGGGWGEITFMDGLTFKTQAGLDIANVRDYMYWDTESGDGYGYGGLIEEVNSTYATWNWQNVLNFTRTFNSVHNLTATAVQEYTHSETEYMDGSVYELSDPFFSEHIISNTFGQKDVGGWKSENGLASYMFRANYNYDSKYYIGASIRYDGLSKLPKDTRWGTFWGASAAWRLSREKFWTEAPVNEWFNDLRLRASYATIGNSALGSDYPYLGTYGAKLVGPMAGIAWNVMGNNNLKWETTETFDIGLDGALFNNRMTFEIAYWQKNSKDLVLRVPTPPTMGIPNNYYYDNIGKIKNSGFELTVGGTIINTKDWNWHSDINFSTVKNTVKELYGGTDIIDNYTIIREGESYQSLYGYDYYGVNAANGNPIWRKADGSLVQFDTFGAYDYAEYDPSNPEDVSKPSSLTNDDRKILGKSMPTWYGGWNNTVTFRDFDLNVFFRFSGGNKLMNASRQSSLLNMDFANNGTELLGRWVSPEQPGDGMTPKIGYGDGAALFNDGFSDSHFVENASYLKLATLTLGYTIPKTIVSKLGMSKIRLYLQGQNLFTITGYSGLDPETQSRNGVDWNGMPQQRSFTFGANVTF
ncbi:SusC/RagA family TonB-linked outer membrane protein [Parabacteroides distasonis]|jgi:TonB-linked SusC/RagA family outer membrane protein|nr:SusC/RagA family TonB-linked outer membrane protein [Parabacteroides distasonis]